MWGSGFRVESGIESSGWVGGWVRRGIGYGVGLVYGALGKCAHQGRQPARDGDMEQCVRRL